MEKGGGVVMRTFLYSLTGLIISSVLFYALSQSLGEELYVIILSTIVCGCTGAIVSAIKSEKDTIITKESIDKTTE